MRVSFWGPRASTRAATVGSSNQAFHPELYLEERLGRKLPQEVIDRLARGHPINRLAELLPWNWHHPAAKLAA